jgi:dGTPase
MDWIKLLSSKRSASEKNRETKGDQLRSSFEQDYDRIIFSQPFRRLQDKTQVFPLPEHDFVHTRLTHSLEVSSVGRSLGKKTGEILLQRYPELIEAGYSQFDFGAIVAAASLAHDLGNPPFGHAGEDAISDFFRTNPIGFSIKEFVSEKEWEDLTNFEGNAQGFRILNKKGYQGLKLTYATLAAFSKYPRESKIENRDKERRSQKKYGFFQSEKDLFKEIAESTGLNYLGDKKDLIWTRHPLTFLVEAADDICYHIIDLEDGCLLNCVSFQETKNLLLEIIRDKFNKEKFDKIKSKSEKIGILRALAINTLIEESAEIFIQNEQNILEGNFDIALCDEVRSSAVLQEIKNLSINNIYNSREVLETEAAGYVVLAGLLEAFATSIIEIKQNSRFLSMRHKSLYKLLPEEIHDEISNPENSIYHLMMFCIDYISGMTDTSALSLYRKIKGISLPGALNL